MKLSLIHICNSLPLIIDELQLIKDNRKDFDRMIYQLSEGVGLSLIHI